MSWVVSTTSGQMKLFHTEMKPRIASTANVGLVIGRAIRQKIPHSFAPSIRAASMISVGISAKVCRSRNTPRELSSATRMTAV